MGSLSTLELDKKLIKIKKTYNKKKIIMFCLDSSPKYIDENGNFKEYLNYTLEILFKIKTETNFKIILKPHPFQEVSKPFKNYNRKQLDLNIFSEFIEKISNDNNIEDIVMSKYIIVNNSSVVYEMAYLKKTCLVIARNEKDLLDKNLLYKGGFTPEIPGKIVLA